MDSPLSQFGELILIAIICVVVLSAVAILGLRRAFRYGGPTPMPVYPPELHFSGQGTTTVEAAELIVAKYRIDYVFPDAVLIKVEMIETTTGSSELILLKSGSGVAGFAVETAGRHLFQVEPTEESAQWSLTIKAVGLLANRDL